MFLKLTRKYDENVKNAIRFDDITSIIGLKDGGCIVHLRNKRYFNIVENYDDVLRQITSFESK